MSADPSNLDRKVDCHLLIEQAGTAIVGTDVNGRIRVWNLAAAAMFGAGADEMRGTDWVQLIPHEARADCESVMRAAQHTGKGGDIEFSLRDKHGDERRLAAIITPIANAAGEWIGGLACVRDISNRLRLQERVAEQTKMVALGELAGTLSHHFNNILGGAITSVDFALASGDVNIMMRVMEKTAVALSRATGLVTNLLAFAEGSPQDVNLCDLGEVLVDVLQQTEDRLRNTGITVEADLGAIPVVPIPYSALHTALTHLVDNAIEAMPTGGILHLTSFARAHDVFVRVQDSGVGMDHQSVARVFEPFFSTKRGGETTVLGRGLGLAVAHGIIKVLHGEITLFSRVGEGTTLEIRLPLPSASSEPCDSAL